MACLDDNLLSGFLQGTLEPVPRAEVEEHIDSCAECRVLLSALGQITAESVREPTSPAPLQLETLAEPGVPVAGDLIADKYRVERWLNVGGMGVLVAATHLDLQQVVALKFMRASILDNPAAVKRFLAEARAVSRLKSGHVGRVLDLGKLPSGSPYIAMEYLEGVDLERHLEAQGPLGTEETARHVLQALEAITEAHAAGIIHRDLKPANLFLTKGADGEPWIKVLDFGVSKYTQAELSGSLDSTDARTVLGSPLYMSPEQLRSAASADRRSDIWSLGCTLYQLTTGCTPFEEQSLPDLIAAILGRAPRPLRARRPEIPEAFANLVERCLSKDPERRPQDANALARELAAFLPLEKPALARHPRPKVQRRAMFAASIAGLTALLAAVLWPSARLASAPASAINSPIDAAGPVASTDLPSLPDVPPAAAPATPAKQTPTKPAAASRRVSLKPRPVPAAPLAEDDILGKRK